MAEQKMQALFANYSFSITNVQQGEWQTFLRALPDECKNHRIWEMLHDLSYARDYSPEPKNELFKPEPGAYDNADWKKKSAKAGK